MGFHGYIDSIGGHSIRGWAFDSANPANRVKLDILLDGAVIGQTDASLYRADLFHAGIGDGYHAFEYTVPDEFWNKGVLDVRVAGGDFHLVRAYETMQRINLELFTQSTMNGVPTPQFGFTQAELGPFDVEIAREILDLWHRLYVGDGQGSPLVGKDNMWELHKNNYQGEFLSLLEGRNPDDLALFLLKMPEKGISHGFLQGEETTNALRAISDEGRKSAAALHLDAFLSFAESAGAVFMESPEQAKFGNTLHADPLPILAELNRRLGFDVTPPNVMDGLFGVEIGGSVINRRDMQAAYTALNAVRALQHKPGATVCEIGGGNGSAAYYAIRFGVAKYWLIDLPVISLLQYYFLRKALPEKRIRVFGDTEFDEADIVIATAGKFAEPSVGPFDLVVNVDSFPEMGDSVCREYLRHISRKAPLLLSINQEAGMPLTENPKGPRQTIMPNLVDEFANYVRLSRHQSWMRRGYANELYSVVPEE